MIIAVVGRTGLIASLPLIAACGRLDFAAEALSTGQSARFPIDASDVTALVAVATPTGFAVVTSRAGGAVTGSTFDFDQGQLTATTQNTALATSPTGSIGAASNGSDVMVAALDGSPATGTSLYPRGAQLAAMAAGASRAGQLAVTNPVASAGDGFAFASVVPATLEVDAHMVSGLGVDTGAPVQIIAGAELPEEASIVPAGGGFAVSYTATAGSPKAARVELLDANFTVTDGPVTANITPEDAFHVRVAWVEESSVNLVAWSEKDVTASDDVWAQVLGPDLEPVTQPTLIAHYSVDPEITADGTGFWLVWEDTSGTPSFLDSAHVGPDGTLTPHAIGSSGGAPGAWCVLDRLDQPVLVWTEIGGTGPDLYIDATE